MQQPPPPQEYPPPQSVAPVAPPTNTLAIVSLVAGIASWVILPVVGAVVAVVCGHLARGQIRRTGESGGGLALAGLLMGYLHLGVWLLVVVILAIVVVVFGIGFIVSGGQM